MLYALCGEEEQFYRSFMPASRYRPQRTRALQTIIRVNFGPRDARQETAGPSNAARPSSAKAPKPPPCKVMACCPFQLGESPIRRPLRAAELGARKAAMPAARLSAVFAVQDNRTGFAIRLQRRRTAGRIGVLRGSLPCRNPEEQPAAAAEPPEQRERGNPEAAGGVD